MAAVMDIERLQAELATQTERADYAWRNVRIIDKARMEDRARFEGLAERCRRLEALVADFLALDDWHDDAIAPAELIQRARAEVRPDVQHEGRELASVPLDAPVGRQRED